jgi:uncharacterized phage-like protein YoqJ
MNKIAVTGHRPPRLGGYNYKVATATLDTAFKVLEHFEPKKVITGMALGFDIAVAKACLIEKIPFIAVLPFRGQERKWSERDIETYHKCLEGAETVIYHSVKSNKSAYIERDKYMVDMCDYVVGLYDGVPIGGTHETMMYACQRRVSVYSVWHWYKDFADAAKIVIGEKSE